MGLFGSRIWTYPPTRFDVFLNTEEEPGPCVSAGGMQHLMGCHCCECETGPPTEQCWIQFGGQQHPLQLPHADLSISGNIRSDGDVCTGPCDEIAYSDTLAFRDRTLQIKNTDGHVIGSFDRYWYKLCFATYPGRISQALCGDGCAWDHLIAFFLGCDGTTGNVGVIIHRQPIIPQLGWDCSTFTDPGSSQKYEQGSGEDPDWVRESSQVSGGWFADSELDPIWLKGIFDWPQAADFFALKGVMTVNITE